MRFLKPNKPSFKNKLFFGLAIVFFSVIVCIVLFPESFVEKSNKDVSKSALEEKYSDFLVNHPFRKSMQLSEEERLAQKLPPNKFFEQEYLYTSDPHLLRPAPERLYALQQKLKTDPSMRTPPGDPTNLWEERGPNNVGGRTRALTFLPGSTTKVLAGGVSGGLWINNNITSSGSQWQRVNGVPGNLSVTSITIDPNNTDIMYLCTGEVYTGGDVIGNGIYKSTDGGTNWFELITGIGTAVEDKFAFVQDVVAWNNPVTNQTEVYFGAGSTIYREEVEPGSDGWDWHGLNTIGLWKSTDGTNFSRLTGATYTESNGTPYSPNNFDIGADGTLWMGTRRNAYGYGGGYIFKNTGSGWTNVRNLGTNGRVELACSKQTAGKIYVLAEDRVNTTNPAKIYRTTNGFSTAPTLMAYPNDADTGISANDFTRGQSFYDLMIGVDPTNDATVYVGGIDLFKSTNSAGAWSQFSHWYGGFGYQEVHADQHGIAFAPGMSNRVIFGNDGGIFYSNNGGSTTSVRNNGYNVTQFYKGAINQNSSTEILLAGAQDNGSQLKVGALPGINSTTEVTGGDGCWAFIDQDDQYMVSSYVYNNYRYITIGGSYLGDFPNSDNSGDFVNQCGLDSNTNILLSNATNGTTYRIYRWAINPSGPSVTRSTLTNSMLNTVPTYFVASPYTANRFLVGTALGKIIRLNNVSGTPTWTDISMPGQIGAVSDIRYGATENDIMVTFHNYGVTSIWYTSNGNSGSPTWVSKEGDLPDMPVKCILQNPINPDEVIIGTALGVWNTSNFTATNPNWTQSQNGMSDVKVMSFDYKAVDGTILAATYGRGMFTGKFTGCGQITEYASGSWSNGAPDSSNEVIINDNYNTAVNGNIDACTLVVNAGKTLTVPDGTYVKVDGNITVNGTLFVANEGSLVQVDDAATVTNNGSITVRKITPFLEPRYFMVLGSPMTAETRSGVYGSSVLVRNHITSNFVPNPDVESQDPGAENFADDDGNDWQNYTGTINAGEGYLVLPQPDLASSGSYTLDYTLGTLNNGQVDYNVTYNGTQNSSPNIVGNPYASAIWANDFLNENSMINAVYFWEHLTTASSSYPGYKVNNYDMGDISMYNSSGGVKAANDTGNSTQPNGYISSGQGFGFKATAAGTASFKNYMRVTDNNDTYRRPTATKDRIWLQVYNETYGLSSGMLVSFSEESINGYDDKYDAKRLATPVSLYSILDTGEELAIQGRSAFNVDQEIPLGFVSQIEENQEFKISISEQDGTVWPDVQVYLVDKFENVVHNLNDSDYIFKSKEGAQNERFVMLFKTTVLGTQDSKLQNISIVPNPTTGNITIVSPKTVINSVEVFDIRGRRLLAVDHNNTQFSLNLSSLQNATYLVKINTAEGTLTKRVVKH
ncbi:MAG: T9SS type A sorting domain-containing protein [Flavobacteriaceae bacterium]